MNCSNGHDLMNMEPGLIKEDQIIKCTRCRKHFIYERKGKVDRIVSDYSLTVLILIVIYKQQN